MWPTGWRFVAFSELVTWPDFALFQVERNLISCQFRIDSWSLKDLWEDRFATLGLIVSMDGASLWGLCNKRRQVGSLTRRLRSLWSIFEAQLIFHSRLSWSLERCERFQQEAEEGLYAQRNSSKSVAALFVAVNSWVAESLFPTLESTTLTQSLASCSSWRRRRRRRW